MAMDGGGHEAVPEYSPYSGNGDWKIATQNYTGEVDSGQLCSSSSSSCSSLHGSHYFDVFSSCLIWWVYRQNVLRMVYNGTNCAEMSCMRNLCKASAMLLPESI